MVIIIECARIYCFFALRRVASVLLYTEGTMDPHDGMIQCIII